MSDNDTQPIWWVPTTSGAGYSIGVGTESNTCPTTPGGSNA